MSKLAKAVITASMVTMITMSPMAAYAEDNPGLPSPGGTNSDSYLKAKELPEETSRDVLIPLNDGELTHGGEKVGKWVQVVYERNAFYVAESDLEGVDIEPVSQPVETSQPKVAVDYSKKVTSGVEKLQPDSKAVMDYAFSNYPKVSTIYGWRASSAYSTDHPNGLAVDIMIDNYKSPEMNDLGWQIARDLQSRADEMNIHYLIWERKIWNAKHPDRGWRPMKDRGDDTQNHLDHVHVSVNG